MIKIFGVKTANLLRAALKREQKGVVGRETVVTT